MDSTLYFGGALILGAFVWFFCAYLCYITAPKKHRRPVTWLILGIVFGPIAYAALYLMPKGGVVPAHPPAAAGSAATQDHGAAGHDHDHSAGSGHSHATHGQTQAQADNYEVPKHKH